jgi:hypothetical protein
MNGNFTPSPGTEKEMLCDVCSANMDVKRDVYGPTGFAEGMAGRGHLHDEFTCPFIDAMWHLQASQLQELARETPSKTFESLLNAEIEQILQTRKETKEVSKYGWG